MFLTELLARRACLAAVIPAVAALITGCGQPAGPQN